MNREIVQLKGSRYGLQLVFSPGTEFRTIRADIQRKLESGSRFFRRGTVIQLVPGVLSSEEEASLRKLFHQHGVLFRVETVEKPSTQSVATLQMRPTPSSALKPVLKPVAKPTLKPVLKPMAEPAPKPVTPAALPEVKSALRPALKPVAPAAPAEAKPALKPADAEAVKPKPEIKEPAKPEEKPAPEGERMLVIHRTLRGGEEIRTPGSVLLCGNVNPGAQIIAGGSIDIRGTCAGMVHAGADGDKTAFIIADRLMPIQIRIANRIASLPDGPAKKPSAPEKAYMKNGRITIEPMER